MSFFLFLSRGVYRNLWKGGVVYLFRVGFSVNNKYLNPLPVPHDNWKPSEVYSEGRLWELSFPWTSKIIDFRGVSANG